MRTSTAEERRRRDVLRFLAVKPDAKLSEVVQACRMTRKDASHALDQLIAEDFVSVRHPKLVWLFGPLISLFVGAERYALTKEGLWRVAREPENESVG
jgi:DNA-binding IclR family transcriptional regulator